GLTPTSASRSASTSALPLARVASPLSAFSLLCLSHFLSSPLLPAGSGSGSGSGSGVAAMDTSAEPPTPAPPATPATPATPVTPVSPVATAGLQQAPAQSGQQPQAEAQAQAQAQGSLR